MPEVTAAQRANNRERNSAHTQIVADVRGKSEEIGPGFKYLARRDEIGLPRDGPPPRIRA